MENYYSNPLKDIEFEEAVYIQNKAPVGSELWTNAGDRKSQLQEQYKSDYERFKKFYESMKGENHG